MISYSLKDIAHVYRGQNYRIIFVWRMFFSSFLIQGWENIRFPHPKSTKTTVQVHFPSQKSWLLSFGFMVQALNLILQYFLHFFTGDKTFCHRWQNTFSPVRKTIRAWSCDTKTMLLWPKDLALTASSTSGTRQKGLSLFAEGPVLPSGPPW